MTEMIKIRRALEQECRRFVYRASHKEIEVLNSHLHWQGSILEHVQLFI